MNNYSCRYFDGDRSEKSIEIQAESLYEAASLFEEFSFKNGSSLELTRITFLGKVMTKEEIAFAGMCEALSAHDIRSGDCDFVRTDDNTLTVDVVSHNRTARTVIVLHADGTYAHQGTGPLD